MAAPYSVYHSFPVGTLRISGNDDSITEVKFCGEEESNNPEAAMLPAVINKCVEELHEYFSGARQQFSVAFSHTGTAFQQKVWKELAAIPYGATISYLELAKRLGDVKSIRAAASTNGKNKIAIIVPCHRVIGANRDLVGYAGGIGMKKWLLQHEAKFTHGVQTLF